MLRACKQQGNFKKTGNKKEAYIQNQKEIFEISWMNTEKNGPKYLTLTEARWTERNSD